MFSHLLLQPSNETDLQAFWDVEREEVATVDQVSGDKMIICFVAGERNTEW